MSVVQLSRVLKHSRSKGSARLVLIALADVANDEGEVTAYARSQKILAQKANVDPGSVRRAIDKLLELEEIEVLRLGDGRKPSDYRIILEEPAIEGAQDEGPRSAGPGRAGRAPSPGDLPPQGAQDAGPITPSLPGVDPSPPDTSGESPADDGFERFWEIYPRRVAKGEARKAWPAAVKAASAGRMGPAPEVARGAVLAIIAGAERYAQETRQADPKFVAHPASWLRAERWGDEPGANRGGGRPSGPRAPIAPAAGPEGRVAQL